MVQLPVISCEGCGACCMEMRSPPFITAFGNDERFNVLPQALKDEYRERVMDDLDMRPDASPCFWLDLQTKKCRHYELRPDICRDFEIGSEECLGWRGEFGIAY